MSNHNTYLKKLKFTLFPPTKFPCNSKVSIHPDFKCSTEKNHNYDHQLLNNEIKNSNYHCRPRTGSTRVCREELGMKETQPRASSSSSVTTKVNQEQKTHTQSQITPCSTILAQQKSCPTLIHSSSYNATVNGDIRDITPLTVQDVALSKTTLSDHIHQKPIYDHPNHHDTREIASAIKRCMLPFKVYYELEWPIPNHHSDSTITTTTWLQLDDPTSNGIERVRKLGFADLDVRLDDPLTRYINSLTGKEDRNVVIQVLFDHSHYSEDTQDATLDGKQVRLLRLRRVYWWSISYNLARTFLPIH
ncbi:unnamed protein product [Mucor circinelloides]